NEFEPQLSLALQTGDPLLREDNGRGNFRSPGFARALAFYANVFEQGWAPPVSETQVSNVWDEFFRGNYAFYLSGPWNIREFRRRQPPGLEDAWGTMPLPGPDGPGAGIAGGTSLVLFRSSPRKEAAWQLVEFLSRPGIQQRFHAMIGNLPPRRSTWEHPALAPDELARAFRDQLERVRPTPQVLEWERIVQEMRLVTERVVRGGLSQEAALVELDARVDRILDKRRWVRDRERERAGEHGPRVASRRRTGGSPRARTQACRGGGAPGDASGCRSAGGVRADACPPRRLDLRRAGVAGAWGVLRPSGGGGAAAEPDRLRPLRAGRSVPPARRRPGQLPRP